MNARYAVLIAVGAALAAMPVSAVPPRPVNALSVTMLPADGTPEELRKLVAAFGKSVAKANSDANEKRAQLDRQMAEGLDKAIAKAQASGDINMVLALKSAKDQFATLTTSDVPLVRNALEFREKKTVEIETARVADTMKAAKDLNDELEKAKKDETIKGNFDTAKAIADLQEKVVAWSKTLRSSAPQPTATAVRPVLPRPNAQPDPARLRTEPPKTIVILATNPDGTSIGSANAGDVFKIQYVGGRWMTGYDNNANPDSTTVPRLDDRCVIVREDNPAVHLAVIPANTKQKPFSFTVPEEGEYALRAWDGMNDYRRHQFADNRGSVRYSVQKVPSAGQLSSPATASSTQPVVASPSRMQPSPMGGSGNIRIVRISGSDTKQGSLVGTLSKGDTVYFRYRGGTWRAMELSHTPLVSPDDEDLVQSDYQSCIILQKNRHGMLLSKWGRIPPGTAESPFEFLVPDDGVYYLKIADDGRSDDNAGSVQYEAKIVRTGAK